MKKILSIIISVLIALSVASVFYRYIVLEDINYETKPIEEFTEDDF